MTFDPNAPRVVTNARDEAEAALMVSHLESAGIKAFISGGRTSTTLPYLQGQVQVVVQQSDLERAREALENVTHADRNVSDPVEDDGPSVDE